MNLHILPAGPLATNAYLLTDPARGEAVLIDAPEAVWLDVEPILTVEKCRLSELWLTHGHWDHMQGGAEIVRATGAKVRAHQADQILIETPEVVRARVEAMMGQRINLEAVKVDHWLTHGERLSAFGLQIEVRHVPGHCPGSVLFYLAEAGTAIVGDTLFAGGIGRTDFPGGNFAVLEKAIREQIYTLPEKTVVFPGHGPKTTVEHERASNPYVHG